MEYKESNKGLGTIAFLGIMAVIVLVIGGMLFASGMFDSDSKSNADSSVSSNSKTEEKSGLLSNIADKVSGGDSIKCTTKDEVGESVMYFKTSEIRNEFKGYIETDSEGTPSSRMWIDEFGMYIITEGEPMPGGADGMSIEWPAGTNPLDSLKGQDWSARAIAQSMQEQQVAGVSVDCSSWRYDKNVVTPPSNLKFVTMEEMMQGF